MRTKKGFTPYRGSTPLAEAPELRCSAQGRETLHAFASHPYRGSTPSGSCASQGSRKNSRGQVKPPRGFTLIELLVVIAIIGILSSVVLASLNTARQKARDAQRISDLRQIQLGLEFYYDAQNPNSYPVVAAPGGAIPAGPTPPGLVLPVAYLPAIPAEPVAGRPPYKYFGTATTYCVGVNLEPGSTIPSNNSDACRTALNNAGTQVNYARSP